MSAAINLLDKYAKTCYARSDAEIGRNLGLTRATVNGWRKGASHPDAESVEKMALAISEPVGPWLAQIEAERARTPANRKVWLRLAATLGTSLALTISALPSQANGRLDVQTMSAYCVKLFNAGTAHHHLREVLRP